MKEVLVILGSPNSPHGKLGNIAIDRLNYCLNMFDPRQNLILCTGGFGKHFNVSNKPHAEYAMEYLQRHGIDNSFFMDFALSSNTVEDAVKVKEIASNRNLSLKIITSDFHLKRVKIIFDQILADVPKEYHGVEHNLSKNVEQELLEHERIAIAGIVKNGIYI